MGWIGIDLDGVLAEWGEGTSNPGDVTRIGDPIPATVALVKRLLADGQTVKIFTARVGPATDQECYDNSNHACPTLWDWQEWQTQLINAWMDEHLGTRLVITATKDWHMWKLYDDRCVQMIPNTGVSLEERVAELADMLTEAGL